jgi:hypothetical protein
MLPREHDRDRDDGADDKAPPKAARATGSVSSADLAENLNPLSGNLPVMSLPETHDLPLLTVRF